MLESRGTIKTPRQRTARIFSRFCDTKPLLSVDRAKFFTRALCKTEYLPLVLRWSIALAHVMRQIDIHILPDELLVGRGGPPGKYGILYPELEGAYFAQAGTLLESQKGFPHQFTITDLTVIRDELLPYWAGRTFREGLADALPDDLRKLVYKNDNMYEPSLIIYESATLRHSLQWVLDYKKVIERGFEDLRNEAQRLLESLDINNPAHNWNKAPFYRAVIILCEAMRDFALRHAELAEQQANECTNAKRAAELREIARICRRVPWKPAQTFHEALQAQWFTQLASRFEQVHGGIVGNGRIDQYLYPFFVRDREAGKLSTEQALELLDCLWLNMAQFIRLQPTRLGTQIYEGSAHWEHTTIGGVLPDNSDATNELSRLILQSRREMPIPYPDLCARVHLGTPDDFLLDICETIKTGCGAPKLLNDAEIIPLLVAKGASLVEARDYCGSGCSEVRLINRDTYLTGTTWLNLAAILEMTLYDGYCSMETDEALGLRTGDPCAFTSYDEFERAFHEQLGFILRQALIQQYITDTLRPSHMAAPLLSTLHDLCMEEGKDINEGCFSRGLSFGGQVGATGFATVVDSLAAIRELVFENKVIPMDRLLTALRNNFEGFEAERLACTNATKFGNNRSEVDAIGSRLEAFIISQCERHTSYYDGQPLLFYVPVTSHTAMGRVTGATPNGRRAGETLSGGIAPSPGAAREGLSSILHSVAATKCGASTARAARMLDLHLAPRAVAGHEGTKKMAAFIRVWCAQQHWHLHIHMLDEASVRSVRNDPEKFWHHALRVPGYAALPNEISADILPAILFPTEVEDAGS